MLLRFASVVVATHFVAVVAAVVISVASPSGDDASRSVKALELEGQASLRRTIVLVAHVPAIVVLVADPRLRNAPDHRR